MAKEKRAFWDVLFGPYPSEREEKVFEYIIHCLDDGVRLGEIVWEQHVRRYASSGEVAFEVVEGAATVARPSE